MPREITTIRLQPALRKAILREAKKAGLTFSDVVQLLLRAFVDGTVQIGVTQYPPKYLETISKEARALRKAHRAGKVKGYSTAKEMFDDILRR